MAFGATGITAASAVTAGVLSAAALTAVAYVGYKTVDYLNRQSISEYTFVGGKLYNWKEAEDEKKRKKGEEPPYSGSDLGDDPTKCPGEGFEWKGRGDPSSGRGSWYNEDTKESLHPDLNHPPPKKPHWDYTTKDVEMRLNLDGTWEYKW